MFRCSYSAVSIAVAAIALLAVWLPGPAAADVLCYDPATRRVVVDGASPPASLTVEADYPDNCWQLISATFTWQGLMHGTAEFVVKDNHVVGFCAPVTVTHRVVAPLDPQALGCGSVQFVETVLEADGSIRAQTSCPIGFRVGAPVGIPDLIDSTVSTAGGTVMACPAGDGPTLASRGATVTVALRSCGVPIANYPRTDLWLRTVDFRAMQLCQGGLMADADADVTGTLTIGGAIGGGGWYEGGMWVVVAGVSLPPVLDIRVHSPDITGDLSVNLADVGPFSADLLAQSGFRSDFFPDDIVNLADVGIFSAHMSHVCD